MTAKEASPSSHSLSRECEPGKRMMSFVKPRPFPFWFAAGLGASERAPGGAGDLGNAASTIKAATSAQQWYVSISRGRHDELLQTLT